MGWFGMGNDLALDEFSGSVYHKLNGEGTAGASYDDMYNAVNKVYKDLFGQDIKKSSFVQTYDLNQTESTYDDEAVTPDQSREWGIPATKKVSYLDINVDKEMADYMNKNLAKDNPLRLAIDKSGDNDLSVSEIQTYFDQFKSHGHEYTRVVNRYAIPKTFSFTSDDKNKISHFDLENIYAMKHNAVIPDALFHKPNGDGSMDMNAKMSYDEIKNKSIISESDFRKLDVAQNNTETGVCSKDIFTKFDFDKDKDNKNIITAEEYHEGMLKVNNELEKKLGAFVDILDDVLHDKADSLTNKKINEINMEESGTQKKENGSADMSLENNDKHQETQVN